MDFSFWKITLEAVFRMEWWGQRMMNQNQGTEEEWRKRFNRKLMAD